MTMRLLSVVVVAFGSTILAAGEVLTPKIPTPEKPINQMSKQELKDFYCKRRAALNSLSPKQREEFLTKQQVERVANAGGIIRKTEGKGRILYVNLQHTVSTKEISRTMDGLGKYLRIRIDTVDASPEDLIDIDKFLLQKAAKATVIVVDNLSDPAILVAPEDKWAKVNIGKFKENNVKVRTQIELLRAFCYLCGGIGSAYNNPLTGFISSPAQLDESPVTQLPIDVINRCAPYLKQLGIVPYVESTYRKACREGWAPAPTNSIQKAIWDKVHELPTAPIKIAPEARKVRD